jgi:ACT domain-containing protein
MNNTSPHSHVVDDIPVYLTGGLSAADREAFESHVAGCESCSAALADARAMDDSLQQMFAMAKPGEGFEDRMIARFRQQTTRRTLHPFVRRAAIGVAAAILMGSAGVFYQHNSGRLQRVAAASNLKQLGSAMLMYGNGQRNSGSVIARRGDFIVDRSPVASLDNYDSVLLPSADDTSVNGEAAQNVTNYFYETEGVRNKSTRDRKAGLPALAVTNGVVAGKPVQLGANATGLNLGREVQQGVNDSAAVRFAAPNRGTVLLNGENRYAGGTAVVGGNFGDASGSTTPQPSSGAGGGFGGGRNQQARAYFGVVSGGGSVEAKPAQQALGVPAANLAYDDVSNRRGLGTQSAPAGGANPLLPAPLAAVSAPMIPTGLNAGYATLGSITATPAAATPPVTLEMKTDGVNKGVKDFDGDKTQTTWNALVASNAPTQVAEAGAAPKPAAVQAASDNTGGNPAEPALQQTAGDVPKNPPAADTAPPPPPTPDEHTIALRKIIRQGELTFEVDSFDSTVMTISKIVTEETGFVSTTDSDKLANGKVKGMVVVRVPPEHLDTLVLKLRGIGDLKSQKITAQDITKQYTDLESELRAARAMQDRLMDIVKNGKGAVKDLLEAEKQLGVWREKIEQVEGEMRYDNNLVSLSTLSITLMERDIKAAASTSITEQVTMSLETENVEKAYTATRDAIDAAKGRIIQSELKQFDAGQFGATIKAQLPPDQADAVIARIRQMDGRVANFQRERSQTDEGGAGAPLDPSKVKHENVTLALTIYNLANIAPRRTTSLVIVAANVDDVYAAVLDQANKAGARVVSSNLNHPKPDQANGTISLSSTSDKADALLANLRTNGELLGQESTDNPDTQNVTDAKRGIVVQVVSLASVQARQSETLGIASSDVPGAFTGILDALRLADARIIASQLNQQDPANQTATIVFDISRSARPGVNTTIDKLGEVFAQNITRSQDTANTLDSKIHCELTLQTADVLPARETTTLGVEVKDVQKSVEQLITSATELGGREIDKDISQDQNGRSVAHVIVEVPLSQADILSDQIESWGHRRSRQVNHNAQAPKGKLARGRLEVTLADAATGLGGEETTSDAIRNGLAVSGQGLRWSVQMLVIGGCIVLPWIAVLWVGWRLLKRRKNKRLAAVAA